MENAKQISPFGTPHSKANNKNRANTIKDQNLTGLEERYFFTIRAILNTIA